MVVTLQGAPGIDDYKQAARAAGEDPRLRPGFALLVDGRRLEQMPSIDEVRGLVWVARQLKLHGVEPLAIVTGSDLQHLAAKLFTTIAGATINLEAGVFRDADAARAWLARRARTTESDGEQRPRGGRYSAAAT